MTNLKNAAEVAPYPIVALSTCPQAIPSVAAWLHGEWLARCGWTRAQVETEVRSRAGPESLPVAFVALEAGTPAGTVSLVREEAPLGPGTVVALAGLFVQPVLRGRGIGAALCRQALTFAAQRGLPPPAVYTADAEGFYRRLGWTASQPAVVAGPRGPILVSFMEREPFQDELFGQ